MVEGGAQGASRKELSSALREKERELARQKQYLDMLLGVVIQHSPALLDALKEEGQQTRWVGLRWAGLRWAGLAEDVQLAHQTIDSCFLLASW